MIKDVCERDKILTNASFFVIHAATNPSGTSLPRQLRCCLFVYFKDHWKITKGVIT